MATTLPALPERVWAWLVQMGYDRAGWYSWDRLDHGGERSADRLMPEWQSLQEGQRLNSMPNGRNWMTVAVLEPNRTLVLRSSYELPSWRSFDPRFAPLPRAYADAIWGFHLRRAPGGNTRLVVRKPGRAARDRSPCRSTCCPNPNTSSCRPASSTTCVLGSAGRCDVGRGSGGCPEGLEKEPRDHGSA